MVRWSDENKSREGKPSSACSNTFKDDNSDVDDNNDVDDKDEVATCHHRHY